MKPHEAGSACHLHHEGHDPYVVFPPHQGMPLAMLIPRDLPTIWYRFTKNFSSFYIFPLLF